MKNIRIILLWPAIVLALLSNDIFANDGPVEEMKLFVEAFNKQDAVAVANLFHVDASMLPAGKPMVSGREAIQSYWEHSFSAGVSKIKKSPINFVVSGNLAVQLDHFVVTFNDMQFPGTDTLVWQKNASGEWKISTDIWSNDQ